MPSQEELAAMFRPVAEQLVTSELQEVRSRLDKVTGGGSTIRADRIRGKVKPDVLSVIDDSQIEVEPNDVSPATNLEDMLVDLSAAVNQLRGTLDQQLPVYVSTGRILDLENTYAMGTLSSQTLVANRLYYTPFYAPADINVDAVLFEIMTLVNGQAQCGIYENDVDLFLPTTQVALGTKTNYGALGIKTQTFYRVPLVGGRWYWAAICSVTAHGIRGTSSLGAIPSIRGGGNSDFATKYCMCFENLTAGWANLPLTATPQSQGNLWLKVAARQGTGT